MPADAGSDWGRAGSNLSKSDPDVCDGFLLHSQEVSLLRESGECFLLGRDGGVVLRALEHGNLDTALVYDIGLPTDVERMVIYKTEAMAVLAANDSLAEEADIDVADLVTKPLIMLKTAPSTEYTQLMFAQRGLRPNIGAVVPQIDLVRAMVGRGLGYSLLMSRPNQIPISTEGKELVTRHLRPRAGQTSVVAVWPKETTLSARAAAITHYGVEILDAIDRDNC